MITLLAVALPKNLPTVNQCAAVPLTGPAGICAAARGDEVIELAWGLCWAWLLWFGSVCSISVFSDTSQLVTKPGMLRVEGGCAKCGRFSTAVLGAVCHGFVNSFGEPGTVFFSKWTLPDGICFSQCHEEGVQGWLQLPWEGGME